jgi:hypothetical protein
MEGWVQAEAQEGEEGPLNQICHQPSFSSLAESLCPPPPPPDPFTHLSQRIHPPPPPPGPTRMQVLRDASEDRRCCGLLAVLGGRENFGGLAQLQELRAALLEFKVGGWGWGGGGGRGGEVCVWGVGGGGRGCVQWGCVGGPCCLTTGRSYSPNHPPLSVITSVTTLLCSSLPPSLCCEIPHQPQAKAGGRAPLMAYSNAFGEGGSNATAVYFLASAFDGVYTPPTSMVSLLGFEASQVGVGVGGGGRGEASQVCGGGGDTGQGGRGLGSARRQDRSTTTCICQHALLCCGTYTSQCGGQTITPTHHHNYPPSPAPRLCRCSSSSCWSAPT